MTYDDYRLAAIYDADNLGGVDHDYFRALVDRPGVQRIVDLGCGTGSLTVTLTGPARRLIGIDPAAAMLAYAAARPGGDAIEWRLGTSESIDPDSADLIIMSANVSMHTWSVMRGRPPWPDVASGLVPGGTLAFESRNPAAEAWRTWNDQTTERETAGWSPTGIHQDHSAGQRRSCEHVLPQHFLDAGGILDVEQRLQFRTAEQIVADLDTAGLKPQASGEIGTTLPTPALPAST